MRRSRSVRFGVAVVTVAAVAGGLGACAVRRPVAAGPVPVQGGVAGATVLDQGPDWTGADRAAFYSQDQGSRIVRLAWLRALPQPGAGGGSMAAGLARYGYLPDPPAVLPVGFTVAGTGAEAMVGMTCAACHTRQIRVSGAAYRIDGGPAIVDFQAFVSDLDQAFGRVLGSDARFDGFAGAVLGHAPSAAERAALRAEVGRWFGPFHTLMTRALPVDHPWGVGRLDAVGMILDRVTGLDIGAAPDRVIDANIRRADAPVRYPFLWNADRQDHTQWPGFAPNGNWLLALGRNVGEVYGVFADLAPVRDRRYPIGYDYLRGNSADMPGLQKLDTLMTRIGPPRWPFGMDPALAARGAVLFGSARDAGRCAGCHWPRPGAPALFGRPTWATPILDVGTDRRELALAGWTAQTGVLSGAGLPLLVAPLKPVDASMAVLKVTVLGAITQYVTIAQPLADPGALGPARAMLAVAQYPKQSAQLTEFYDPRAHAPGYEARVLQGVWAAAPYLHNGAVPTLADLLEPPARRPASFALGGDYDVTRIGLAQTQTGLATTVHTTADCAAPLSGDSRCGHDYGTDLSADDKTALLEYLKTL